MVLQLSLFIRSLYSGLDRYTANLISVGLICAVVLSLSFILYLVTKYFIIKMIKKRVKENRSPWAKLLLDYSLFTKISYSIPLTASYSLLYMLDSQDVPIADFIFRIVEKILSSLIILNTNIIIIALLNVAGDFYQHTVSLTKNHPIKSYIQVAKIISWMFTIILFISNLGGTSPLSMLTGLGALSAVFMMVFKDSILGFVSSIHVSVYDIVRIGDWISLKADDIDGIVIDISLNVVKIRSFDNSVITIPTQTLVEKGVINWREMQESGGRRIRKSINLDMTYIKFCDTQTLQKLSQIELLASAINIANADKGVSKTMNPLTNLALYRQYVSQYLQARGDIHNKSTTLPLIVRALQPGAQGLPLEIYAFTTTTDLIQYERIQSEIVEHIVAILPVFNLKTYTRG